jgi:hypothetical protein
VYDVTSRKTFDALPGWFSEIDARTSATVPKILVGNKVDMVLVIFSGHFLYATSFPPSLAHITLAF